MDYLFPLLFFGFFIGLPGLFIYGMYLLGKKLQSKNFGLTLAGIFSFGYLFLWFYALNEDLFFTKSDAKEILDRKKIFLVNDFKLTEKDISGSIGDYYQSFTIELSAKDNEMLSQYLRKKIDSNTAVLQKYPKSKKRFYRVENGLVQEFPTERWGDSEEVILNPKDRTLTYELDLK